MPNAMATQSNIGGALCESSVIPFLVACRKFWLTLTARVPYIAANIGERKTWTQSEFCTWQNSVRGKSPRRYSLPAQETAKHRAKVWLASVERHRCSNEAKTWNPFKFAAVPQTRQLLSAVGGPKFTILRGHLEEALLCKIIFRLSIYALVAKTEPGN